MMTFSMLYRVSDGSSGVGSSSLDDTGVSEWTEVGGTADPERVRAGSWVRRDRLGVGALPSVSDSISESEMRESPAQLSDWGGVLRFGRL